MCYHHYAPTNLQVSTSWGDQGQLTQTSDGVYGLLLSTVPVNQDLWLAFLDINLCPTGSIYVTTGVTANGVTLASEKLPDGRAALALRLDASGKVGTL